MDCEKYIKQVSKPVVVYKYLEENVLHIIFN